MYKYICLFTIFGTEIFFSVIGILGRNYEGSESSYIYIVYTVAIMIFGISQFIFHIVIRRYKFNMRELLMTFSPVILFLLFIINMGLGKNSDLAQRYFLFGIVWTIPAIYSALYVVLNQKSDEIIMGIEPLMILFTLAAVRSTLNNLFWGNVFSGLGGETYQTASYVAAFAFGINLYFLIYGTNHKRYRFFQSRLYKIISFLLLPIQLISVLASGGRGGVVLSAIYIVYLSFEVAQVKNVNKIIKFSLVGVMAVTLFFVIMSELASLSAFQVSISRSFSFISGKNIDWKRSGRIEEYQHAFELIKKAPLLGYGYYGMWKTTGYPHNIVLEIMLQGGFILFGLSLFGSIIIIYKNHMNIKFNNSLRVINIISLYAITILLFTGTYTISSKLWFVITFIVCYKIQIKKPNSTHIEKFSNLKFLS